MRSKAKQKVLIVGIKALYSAAGTKLRMHPHKKRTSENGRAAAIWRQSEQFRRNSLSGGHHAIFLQNSRVPHNFNQYIEIHLALIMERGNIMIDGPQTLMSRTDTKII
jgi:hypothetical protein